MLLVRVPGFGDVDKMLIITIITILDEGRIAIIWSCEQIEKVWQCRGVQVAMTTQCPVPMLARKEERHRVDRVLGLFSNRPNWDFPTSPPHPLASVSSPSFGPGGVHTRLRERGCGGPNSDKGTDCYSRYICTLREEVTVFLRAVWVNLT